MSTLVEFWPNAVLLYLEPTTGGVILQIVFGGVTGLLVLVKLFWYRLGSLFRRRTIAPDPEGIKSESHEPNEP